VKLRVRQQRRVGQPPKDRDGHLNFAIHGTTERPDRAQDVIPRLIPLAAIEGADEHRTHHEHREGADHDDPE
jgi:hypothetical protein